MTYDIRADLPNGWMEERDDADSATFVCEGDDGVLSVSCLGAVGDVAADVLAETLQAMVRREGLELAGQLEEHDCRIGICVSALINDEDGRHVRLWLAADSQHMLYASFMCEAEPSAKIRSEASAIVQSIHLEATDYSNDIVCAVEVLKRIIAADDAEAVRAMREAFDGRLQQARWLVHFIPIALGRLLLEDSGVHLPDQFFTIDESTGEKVEHNYADYDLFQQALETLPSMLKSGMLSYEEASQIACRSPEMDAVSQFESAGSDLRNVVLSPIVFT